MTWSRLLWGVEFGSRKEYALIGDTWNNPSSPSRYEGEPVHALTFTTRALARKWCDAQNARQANRADWWGEYRYRVVRVRETVRKV